jgi:hypothetical protein
MNNKQKEIAILETFADIAARAGVHGKIDDAGELFVAAFELDQGRSQMVYVKPLAEAIKGQDAVCIYSPCRKIDKGLFKGLGKDESHELLKLNSQLIVARYGVLEFPEGFLVMASVDALLDSLDPGELEAFVWYIAIAADQYERKFGKDEF